MKNGKLEIKLCTLTIEDENKIDSRVWHNTGDIGKLETEPMKIEVKDLHIPIRVRQYPVSLCPGFGKDRVNFHRTPGRGTAGWADPTWPNRAGYSIPCAITLGSRGGERSGRNSLAARDRAAAVQESGSVLRALFCGFVLCIPLFCTVVVPVPSVCCSVKLPLSRPTSVCLFLSILLRTPVGGGAAAWRFCCRPQPNQNTLEGRKGLKPVIDSLLKQGTLELCMSPHNTPISPVKKSDGSYRLVQPEEEKAARGPYKCLQISAGWVSGGWGQALFSGAQ